MRSYFIVSIFFISTLAQAEKYSCEVEYFEVAKMTQGLPKPSQSFMKTVDLAGFKTQCSQGKCQKFTDVVKTKTDHIMLISHNSKPPVLATMLMHMKYDKKLKDFTQQAYSGTDFGNRLYLGTRSGGYDISVECKFSPNKKASKISRVSF